MAMDLRAWRKKNKLGLKDLAPILGVSIGTVSMIERGAVTVSRETTARILGATNGRVGVADLFRTYAAHFQNDFLTHRAAGRGAMAAFRKTATKPRK